MPDLLTVGELIAISHLRTRCLAGALGLARRVSWAQVYDIPDPWEWMSPGELVLANGYGVPAGARAQCEYLTRLDGAGAAGFAISEGHFGPPITDAMLATADRLDLPFLETAWEVSYSSVARAVASAGHDQAAHVLAQAQRVYEALSRATVAGLSGGALITSVAASQACRAVVLDRRTGEPLMTAPDAPVPEPLVHRAAREMLVERSTPVHLIRVEDGEERGVAVSLPLEQAAMLLVSHRAGDEPDGIILRHLGTVAAGELARLRVLRSREQDRGSVILSGLLDGLARGEALVTELGQRGLIGPLQALALDPVPHDPEMRHLYFAAADSGPMPLVLVREDGALVVLPHEERTVERAMAAAGADARAGLSEPIADPSRIRDGIQQARWALRMARATGSRVVRHGHERLAAFLPASAADAHSVVAAVLGPVIAYDTDKGGDLLHSLRVFLEVNRSWQRAASDLFIHKQTLVYRIRKVEELTGLRLDQTDDVTQLWLALRIHQMVT